MSRSLDLPSSSSSRSPSPGLPQKLPLLLLPLLLLLHVSAQRAQAAPQQLLLPSELRCKCVRVTQGIHHSKIQNVEVIPAGPHCSEVEVIATLKNSQIVCLNPQAPLVKKLIKKLLNKN
ncbi:permeability factor 2-like [Ornithorhynchus anatinus]|uniref:C-X-C motif chemokine n=2 Tax=Ornithorhynchus anatinus TaxID=9258 RepID=F7EQQ1_ORNAN|nr:permeability factor 2-like [Ornithorhynchus anatinus]